MNNRPIFVERLLSLEFGQALDGLIIFSNHREDLTYPCQYGEQFLDAEPH